MAEEYMAHSKQALKRHRQSLKRRAHNRVIKSEIKTAVRKYRETVIKGEDAAKQLPTIDSRLDRAAKNGVIPRGRANRIKGRLRKFATAAGKTKTA
ncbi:30S ribosomal protein S20 [bacterium]|nr:MAG: 30S ribosomal protein S20 [bacterium]RIK62331.1 MAG: 30S ribosomal protein S20 [Planctomycetota bacterium]